MGINALPGEEEVVIDVPTLQTVPVLPADYPLFDWADWPDSRAALVQGGMTKNFEKACWNAIIDTLADALEAAEIGFYDNGGTLVPEDLKMPTGKYGRLTAWRMNTTLDAIDDVVPLPWRWAFDRSFRGYTGATRFQGRSTNSQRKGDTVYPEYILELVRRLNMILEFMRDTYPYTYDIAAKGYVNSLIRPGLVAGRGVPIIRSMNIPLLVSTAPLTVSKGVRLDPKIYSKINPAFTAELLHSASIEVRMPIPAPIKASAEVKRAATGLLKRTYSRSYVQLLIEHILPAEFCASVLSHPAAKASLELLEGTAMEAGALIKSLSVASADQLPPVHTAARMQVYSWQQATGTAVASFPIEKITGHSNSLTRAAASSGIVTHTKTKPLGLYSSAKMEGRAGLGIAGSAETKTASTQEVTPISVESLPTGAEHRSTISREITIIKGKIRPGWVEQKSGSRVAATMDQALSMLACAQKRSTTTSVCSLGNGWLPPVWINGGLWIRQVFEAVQNEDGSLEVH